MNPAFSVLFFTTLSGAGYGLLSWAALAALTGGIPARALLVALLLGMLLSAVGLLASFWHLGKPLRAWRAFSQWRTSWLSREGVLAVASFVPAVLLAASMLPAMLDGSSNGGAPALNLAGHAIAVALIACALATVYSTAMIYASLPPIPAWRHRLVVPVYLGFALFTGGLMLATLASMHGATPGGLPALLGITLALALWAAKQRYWRDLEVPLQATRGDAIGLTGRSASVFERPHTEASYITREMAFVVARTHARWLRRFAIVAFALVPLACLLPVWWFAHLQATPWLVLATASAVAGAFVERWLFFAQARHMVTLYY
jgi:sulfite dehydrogenase (quinone) subunit SoeC